jgi:N-acylneuraminate cytidylyltransferase
MSGQLNPRAIAFIPARSGSKRVPHKNIRRLGAHPTLAYSIAAAKASGVFDTVMLCTDDPLYQEIGDHYGASVPFLRPAAISTAVSPDIDWVRFVFERLSSAGETYDIFSILRPTNPFRRASTIQTAYQTLATRPGADSLRAVSLVTEHPGKMWVVRGGYMHPLLALTSEQEPPWHSQQLAALPPVYKQNASLEVAWSRIATGSRPTIAGEVILPFISEGYDGFDINSSRDLAEAEALIAAGAAVLPVVDQVPFPKTLPTDP